MKTNEGVRGELLGVRWRDESGRWARFKLRSLFFWHFGGGDCPALTERSPRTARKLTVPPTEDRVNSLTHPTEPGLTPPNPYRLRTSAVKGRKHWYNTRDRFPDKGSTGGLYHLPLLPLFRTTVGNG